MDVRYDVVIIGAGVNGLSTAWRLLEDQHTTSTKLKVCVLEQFPKGHNRGSSHGATRCTRYAYADAVQTGMMKTAYSLWSQLEDISGEKLFVECGLLTAGCEELMNNTENSLKVNKLPSERLNTEDIAQRFPAAKGLGPSVLDPKAGILLSGRCMEALHDRIKSLGGEIRYRCPVESIERDKDRKTVRVSLSTGDSLLAENLVLTPGAWAGLLLSSLGLDLPLRPIAVTMMFWQERHKSKDFQPDKFPTFFIKESGYSVYGIPAFEYQHMSKIAFHDGPVTNPDTRDENLEPPYYLELMNTFIQKHFPQLKTPPAVVEKCIYTMTPDRKMILDKHPNYDNIFFCCGCS